MKPKQLKKLLMSEIKSVSESANEYCFSKGKDFTRKRKLSFETVIKTLIGMENKTLSNELITAFNAESEIPSASAFVQQRHKIKPEAFKAVFDGFTSRLVNNTSTDLRIFAVDGSDIQIATNPDDATSYFSGANDQKSYNLLHLNALYDLNNHIYSDAIIQGGRDRNEHSALQEMVDHSDVLKALVIADRGYESFNSMAHIQEKGWFFLIRIRDNMHGMKNGFDFPAAGCFDTDVCLKLTRKQTNEVKDLLKDKKHYRLISATQPFDYLPLKNKKSDPTVFYELKFRIVRFLISEGVYETIVTNLDRADYPPDELKKLYAARWGIETSFRDLKYTIGLLDFHSKKAMCIHQEIYAHLIMYNFAEMITSHVVIKKKQRKYTYKANFSVAAHMCRLFYLGKTTSLNLETIIARNTIPVRPGRHRERRPTVKVFHGFLYRVA